MLTTVDYINMKTNGFKPEIGVVLGSGLGGLANGIEVEYAPSPLSKVTKDSCCSAPSQAARSLPCKGVSTIMRVIPWRSLSSPSV